MKVKKLNPCIPDRLKIIQVLFLFFAGNLAFFAQERPNILFAFGDDLGRVQSIYHTIEGGNTLNSLIQTPNFDRLSEEGILFLNAHVNAPQCTPGRSSLLTGRYFWSAGRGAILQGAVWEDTLSSFPVILRQNGYHIGYSYKVWFPGTPVNAPFKEDMRYEGHGRDFNFFSQTIFEGSDGNLPESEINRRKQQLFDEVLGNFNDFLSEREKGQPFFYWWGPWNTHLLWAKGSGKRLWNIDPEDLHPCVPPTLPDVPEIREDLSDYLGECVAFDVALGLLVQRLEEIGELDHTVIIVSGDNGMGFPRAKCNLYNQGTHMPLSIRYPGIAARGRVVEDFVNLMDLAPTILDLARLPIPEEMDGKSLVPVLQADRDGLVDPARDFVVTGIERHVASARAGRRPYASRAIIHLVNGRKYKYIRNFRPQRWPMGNRESGFPDLGTSITKTWYLDNYCNERYRYYIDLAFAKRPYEELYDLEDDPYELINLAEDPSFREVKTHVSVMLDSVLIQAKDPRMTGGGEGISKFDRYPYTVPYR